jgi:hypothetical protein
MYHEQKYRASHIKALMDASASPRSTFSHVWYRLQTPRQNSSQASDVIGSGGQRFNVSFNSPWIPDLGIDTQSRAGGRLWRLRNRWTARSKYFETPFGVTASRAIFRSSR